MKHTQFVLDETQFFLSKMEENQESFPDFNYYLNAYISAARSVLWIIKNEYCKVSGWLEWYDSTEVDHDKELLLKGIVEMRNRSLKKAPLQIKQEYIIGDKEVSYNIYDEITPFVGKKISLTIEQTENSKRAGRISDDNTLVLKGTINKINSVQEFKNKDILDVCRQYFDWLNQIVKVCIKQFG